jgi:hypothetical protein
VGSRNEGGGVSETNGHRNGEIEDVPLVDYQSEVQLLSCYLSDPEQTLAAANQIGIRSAWFDDLNNRRWFEALHQIVSDGESIMMQHVLTKFGNTKDAQERFGQILNSDPFPNKACDILPILKDLHQRRGVIFAANQAIQLARDKSSPASSLTADLTRAVSILAPSRIIRTSLSMRTPNEIVNMTFDDGDNLMGNRLLARGQAMTMLAPGGTGKSRILLQMLACLVNEIDFCGFACRGKGMKWLVLQTENSNRRLHDDFINLGRWLGDARFDLFSSSCLIHTMEHDEDGMVFLSDPANQKALSELIESSGCDGIAFDPLGDFAIGDPNKDQDMRETCQTISRICKKDNPNRCIIISHHAITGKAGAMKATGFDRASYGRNSKVLHSWVRGQINISPVDPENNERLVLSCGKCSNGREFQTFGIRLNPDKMIYEVDPDFDIETWEEEVGKTPNKVQIAPDQIRSLCPVAGVSKENYSKLIIKETGCSRATAYRWIDKTLQSKLINRSKTDENYFRA